MAIQLSANYSKKLGLPNYSSHSFSAAVTVELTDITQVQEELQKLYALLQTSVDQEIQNSGYVPSTGNSSNSHQHPPNGNGNGRHHQNGSAGFDHWNCTDGQKSFILRIVNENNLDKQEVENLSQQLFQTGVKQLNRMQASQLIEDLLIKVGKPARQNRWRQPQQQQ
jgi:hypothetical protein